MVFTTHVFLFYFLPSCLLVYYLLPRRWRNLFLTLASYVFYGWWVPWFSILMMVSTAVDFTAGRVISAPGATRRRRIVALVCAMTSNLTLLGFFKYAMFVQGNLNVLLAAFGADTFEILKVTLPIGISFYTFQTMSYTIDVYRGDAPPVKNLTDFSCFVALFPQLVAGPIVRYNTIAEQLDNRTHSWGKFSAGVAIFALGFAKKILLANPMGEIADTAFALDAPTVIAAWWGITAYAFQIYFDFAGYSDMAIGLGRMFGFEFMENFKSPYHADSITDFWRRWHISLSTFLRDYLYLPLGGNRKGPRRTYINLALVMLLGGLWHGAAWQFVAWGAFHGALLAAERALGKKSVYTGLPRPFRVALTFVLVLIAWVLFRAPTLGAALEYLGAMFGLRAASAAAPLAHADIFSLYSIAMMAVCAFVISRRTRAFDFADKLTPWRVVVVLVAFVVAIAAMFTQAFNPFLYFQF